MVSSCARSVSERVERNTGEVVDDTEATDEDASVEEDG